MSVPRVHRIPVVSLDDPRYARLARRVVFPPSPRAEGLQFFPALAGFNVGAGSDVDVSFLFTYKRDPTGGFDRHLRTEEMFVPLDGDLCLPLAPCRDAADPLEKPDPEGFVCVVVPHGEAVILAPNVWHTAGWPVDKSKGVRYIMVLSGHRPGQGAQGNVDYIATELSGGVTIVPDWS
jgi:hypothetical protein